MTDDTAPRTDGASPTEATIYHNPRCNTSRTALAALRDAGIEPAVIRYLDTPPTRDELRSLLDAAGLKPGDAVRRREPLFRELGLGEAGEDEILDAMAANPILIERPIVVTAKGTVLARPATRIDEVL